MSSPAAWSARLHGINKGEGAGPQERKLWKVEHTQQSRIGLLWWICTMRVIFIVTGALMKISGALVDTWVGREDVWLRSITSASWFSVPAVLPARCSWRLARAFWAACRDHQAFKCAISPPVTVNDQAASLGRSPLLPQETFVCFP